MKSSNKDSPANGSRVKVYVWAFPGLGKSSIQAGDRIVDADCTSFQFRFPDGCPGELHRREEWSHVTPNPDYPHNYLDYIRSVEADTVLLNCHIDLLNQLSNEHLILIYPHESLKEEYLERYVRRKDHSSYISHMNKSFEDAISAIRQSPFRKLEITKPHVYLQQLIEEEYLCRNL